MSPEDERNNHANRCHRRICDKFTWMIPFDKKAVAEPGTLDYVLELSCFGMDAPGHCKLPRGIDQEDGKNKGSSVTASKRSRLPPPSLGTLMLLTLRIGRDP